MYYGTNDFYLNNLARFVRPGGPIGFAQSGIMNEIDGAIPEHLQAWWAQDTPWCFHSPAWWRRHWGRTGIVDVEVADSLADGWKFWRDWLRLIAPANTTELQMLEADAGRNIGYVRVVGRRRADAPLYDPVVTISPEYTKQPLMRDA
jgi:hypothetical protein